MPAIAIDISGPEPAPAHVAAVVGACRSASRAGSCESYQKRSAEGTSLLIVRITQLDELHFVLVAESTNGQPTVSRSLAFRSADSALERWRSLGIVAASLADELPTTTGPSPPVTPAIAPQVTVRDEARHRPPALSTSETRWRLGAGLMAGTGASGAPPQLGGFVTAAREFPILRSFALVGVRHGIGRVSQGLVDLSWTTLAAGVGGSICEGDACARLQAELVAQRVAADAEAMTTHQRSTASRWLGGGRLGLELVWPAPGPVGAALAGEMTRVSGGTAVRVNQASIGQLPETQWTLRIGLEYRR